MSRIPIARDAYDALGAIDSHAHLEAAVFKDELPQVLEEAWRHGLSGIVAVAAGDSPEVVAETLGLADRNPRIWAVAGVHPHVASQFDRLWPAVEAACRTGKVVGLGEFGLDFHYDFSARHSQMEAMRRQAACARELGLPMVLHIREAVEESLRILDELGPTHEGIIHCFTGNHREAAEFLQRGFHLSIPGVVTFGRNAEALVEAVKSIPLDRLLVETDSPYLAPAPFRGRRNQPAYVAFVVAAIAAIRGMEPREVAAATRDNCVRLLKLNL
jgi:TatD DNase family protein